MKYTARVRPGRGQGRKIGFPTLNLDLPADFDAAQGVYAGRAWLQDQSYPAAIHFGPAPTFGIQALSLEAYLIGANIPEPPGEVAFELVKYLRPIVHFDSPEALARQIAADVQATLDVI